MCPNDTQNASFGPEYVFFINLLCYFINLWFFYPTLITLTPYAHLYNPQLTCIPPPCQQPNEYFIYSNLTWPTWPTITTQQHNTTNATYMIYMTTPASTMWPTWPQWMRGWHDKGGAQGMFLPKLTCFFIGITFFNKSTAFTTTTLHSQ